MGKRIAIFGAGGFGREVLQLIRDINAVVPTWTCEGFLIDAGISTETVVSGLPVLGGIDWLASNPDVSVVVAVGSSAARARITTRIQTRCTNKFATLVHPRAWVGANVLISDGTVVCAGALVTTDINIAAHSHVNIGCTIGHDARLGEFVTLNPGVNVSGNVQLHPGAEVGTGSVLLPGRMIGAWSIVGAGSVVTKDVPADSTVVGAPARVIKERTQGWQRGGPV